MDKDNTIAIALQIVGWRKRKSQTAPTANSSAAMTTKYFTQGAKYDKTLWCQQF